MTQQAIADALGVSKQTVCNDCEQLSNDGQLDDVPEQRDTVVDAWPSSVGITPPGAPGRRRR